MALYGTHVPIFVYGLVQQSTQNSTKRQKMTRVIWKKSLALVKPATSKLFLFALDLALLFGRALSVDFNLAAKRLHTTEIAMLN